MSPERVFNPLSVEQEREILTHDDAQFSHTQKYIEALILSVLQKMGKEEERNESYRNLMAQIPIAAKRYLERPGADYKFSTYFSWYIHEEFKSPGSQS